ncbi:MULTISPECIES: GNAT family N-acetyltransferase [Pacificibacter]|uniref:GNAT family N-acetyltransferase n=1 Tax=Pacificibacter TaxID=1042323 RepID=UPI001C0A1470|nr:MULTISPECIES: N-acetyltransferase [Pacificibacter]MBU2934775.1 N-acetyltransferase [Pacificibacter marinus]MDO6615749.1 N-acetyltransferase [Pacificibacter sp. 1_MG-2023]
MKLRPLTQSDDLALSIFLDSEFGKPDTYQAILKLRETNMVAMERLAIEGTKIVGYLCCAKMVSPADWWALTVLVVSSNHRKKGVGRELVYRGMNHARREKAPAVIVVGDPAYFAQVGFSQAAAQNLQLPFAQEFTSLYPIAPGTGLSSHDVIYADAFTTVGDTPPTASA